MMLDKPDHFCCPKCGNTDLQSTVETKTETTGGGFSASKGCLGYLIFGPLGLLCGSCGSNTNTTTTNTTYWNCPKCGHRFRSPEDLRKTINYSLPKVMFLTGLGLGVVAAVILFAIFSQRDTEFAFAMAVIPLAVGALIGCLTYNSAVKRNCEIENEIEQLRKDMNRFRK